MHSLKQTIFVPRPLKECWDFFSNPLNLKQLTPPEMKFEFKGGIPKEMYEGIMLGYTVAPLAGIKLSWYSEITKIVEEKYFVDYQVKGPFKTWHHQHHFQKVDNGTEITDIVHYEIPLGFIGKALHSLFIRERVNEMFEYRHQRVKEIFDIRDQGL